MVAGVVVIVVVVVVAVGFVVVDVVVIVVVFKMECAYAILAQGELPLVILYSCDSICSHVKSRQIILSVGHPLKVLRYDCCHFFLRGDS